MSAHSRPPAVMIAAMDQRAACLREVVRSMVADLRDHNEECHNPWCGMAGVIVELTDDDDLHKTHVAELAAMAIHMLAERADADVAASEAAS